jgi:CBS domain-containing protein
MGRVRTANVGKRDIMTTDVVTVDPDEAVGEVAQRLLAHGISASPVVDRDGRMLGIVSDADLMRRAECGGRQSWWLALLADKTARFTRDLGTRARDVMTRDVATIDEETPIADIARILEGKRITRVPVLRNGQLVGIVSRADVLRALVGRFHGSNHMPSRAVGGSVAVA